MSISIPPDAPEPPRRAPRGAGLRPDDGRLVRGRRSRDRILEAARGLFAERGFDRATLRAIGARAGMGASSIYRHVRSKEELLIEELADRQERALDRFRAADDRRRPTRERITRLLDSQHALLAEDPDLTRIALRATTLADARVARRVLALQDRAIGLLAGILQNGRSAGELSRDADVLPAAQTLFHAAMGTRLAWANGLLSADRCRASIETAVDLLFRGIESRSQVAP